MFWPRDNPWKLQARELRQTTVCIMSIDLKVPPPQKKKKKVKYDAHKNV